MGERGGEKSALAAAAGILHGDCSCSAHGERAAVQAPRKPPPPPPPPPPPKKKKEARALRCETWSVLEQDGPNHLGFLMRCVSDEHQMALITSDCVRLSKTFKFSAHQNLLQQSSSNATTRSVCVLHSAPPPIHCGTQKPPRPRSSAACAPSTSKRTSAYSCNPNRKSYCNCKRALYFEENMAICPDAALCGWESPTELGAAWPR